MNIDFKQLLPDNIKMKVFVIAHNHVMYNMFINKLNMISNGAIDKHMIKQYEFINTNSNAHQRLRGYKLNSELIKIILLNDAFFRIHDEMSHHLIVMAEEEGVSVIRFNTDQFYEEPKIVTEEIRLFAYNIMEGDVIYDPRNMLKNFFRARKGFKPKKVKTLDRHHDRIHIYFTDDSWTMISTDCHLLAVVEKGFDQEKRRIDNWNKKHTL